MKFKKIISTITAAALTCAFGASLIGCGNNGNDEYDDSDIVEFDHSGDTSSALNVPNDNCRTYYEIFVRSFADSNNDGIGDFKGIIDNLDYLNDGDPNTDTDLGINGIWLMPINPSPSYHKYDATDYYDVDSSYGTLKDFDDLVKACDDRGIWLQMDLVLNHSSNRHPWFLEAVKEAQQGIAVKDSTYMKKYGFVLKDDKPAGKYHAVPNSDYLYLGSFSDTQPDLNLDDEGVRNEIKKIVDFWLEHGVRSFRLDAVPWAYGLAASDTGKDNIDFWTWFNDYCNKKGAEVFGDSTPNLSRYCYNVGEVWSTSTVVDKYFETGMSNFNYAYATTANSGFINTAKGSNKSGAAGLISSLAKTQATELKNDSEAILSNFLSNHDNDRSASALSEAIKIKKAAGLYLLMPGNPYIYYGEEIGAVGSGSDPNRRLPFNWGDDSHSAITNPPDSNYKGEQKNGSLKDQKDKTDSILSHYRQVIKLRNRFPEIGRGVMTAYALDKWNVISALDSFGENKPIDVNVLNKSVAVYKLDWKGESVLIIQNVGDETATVRLGKTFNETKLVGTVVADSGSVSVDNKGNVSLPVGGVAVFK